MGAADNKTYRDTYHFNANFFSKIKTEDFPSLQKTDKDVNTNIKENPYRANVNIEKDEVVLQDDLSALFHARGKKHSGGGIDVQLKPGAFIFSDDPTLAFSEEDAKLLELKRGGSFTPADITRTNVDLKHYNNLIENIKDPKKDDLAKNSSMRMLEKYMKTLGAIAFGQEAKKHFPDGLPPFAQDSAPVYNDDVDEELSEQKQYAKYGGAINNPYMQKGGWNLWGGDKQPIFKNKYGVNNNADKISDLDITANLLGYTGPRTNEAFQNWLYNSSPQNKAIIDKWHNTYQDPSIAQPTDKRNKFDGYLGIRWANAIDEIFKNNNKPLPLTQEDVSMTPPLVNQPVNQQKPNDVINPNDVNGKVQAGKEIDWQFTPWQLLSQGYNAYQLASAKKYNPYRSQVNLENIDPALLNDAQAIGDLKGFANQQIASLNTLNPILRNAQSSAIAGQAMNQIGNTRASIQNQNAGILNQTRQYNNQINNQETMTNNQLDQQYYREMVGAQANYDNMKTFLGDKLMNNVMQDVQDNQSLAYNLATLENPAYGFNWKTGNFYRNPMNIKDIRSSDTRGDLLSQYLGEITRDWSKLSSKERIELLKVMSLKGFTPKKQGGVLNPYK